MNRLHLVYNGTAVDLESEKDLSNLTDQEILREAEILQDLTPKTLGGYVVDRLSDHVSVHESLYFG